MNSNTNIFPGVKKVFSNLLSASQLLLQQATANKKSLSDQIFLYQSIYNQKANEADVLTNLYCKLHPKICLKIIEAKKKAGEDLIAIQAINTPLIAEWSNKIKIYETAVENENKAIFAGQTALNTAAQNTAGAITQTAATLAAAKVAADKAEAESMAQIKKVAVISVGSILILLVIAFVIKAINKKKVNQ